MDERMVKEWLSYPYDAEAISRKKKRIKRLLLERDVKWIDKKIAVLTGSTANEIVDEMELFLLSEGIRPQFYLSEYDKYYEDAVFGNPELDAFAPDIVFVHTTSRNIKSWPSAGMSAEEIDQLLQGEFGRFVQVWEGISNRFKCPVIQNNFERPEYRLFGNKDVYDIHGKHNFVYRLNGLLYQYANEHENFFINDVDYASAAFGLDAWQDAQVWYLYKYAMSLKAIPEFAHSVTKIIKSIYGRNKKVLTLDLDNTMWGGIVGDDGVDGLHIGNELPEDEAYLAFQKYIKEQKQIGVVLTIDSKNDEENAIDGLNHPDGAVTPDDFVCIKANWNPKSINLEETATELNLGIDSFVFIDDNPAEREIIKGQLPTVSVPDVTTPEEYIRYIDKGGYFEVTNLTKEDLNKSEMYKANVQRAQSEKKFADYGEYLKSLEMTAVIKSFDDPHIQRIAQLTNKTNQFNLTTKRYSEADIVNIKEDDNYVKLYGRLLDKFGDNGLVSVVFGHKNGEELDIDLWLMSCRVLKRDFEYAMLDCLVADCQEQGLKRLRGHYYPTAKNKMVKEMFAEMGFDKVSEDEEGNTEWILELEGYQNQNKIIEDVER